MVLHCYVLLIDFPAGVLGRRTGRKDRKYCIRNWCLKVNHMLFHLLFTWHYMCPCVACPPTFHYIIYGTHLKNDPATNGNGVHVFFDSLLVLLLLLLLLLLHSFMHETEWSSIKHGELWIRHKCYSWYFIQHSNNFVLQFKPIENFNK